MAAVALSQSAILSAQTPADLADLVGARGGQAEGQLSARGYTLHHASQADDASFTYWWNGQAKRCARIRTSEGRYQAIKTVDGSDCGHRGGDAGQTAAIALGAAALIGAIALSHKSHHHDDDRHYDDQDREASYERGYRDGLYSQAYHNYDRSDVYTAGYQAGVRQRGMETSYRPGYGSSAGFSGYVSVADLIGRSRQSAELELSRRGFVQRDSNRDDYDGRFSTYWRAASEQCIVMNTRGGSVYSVQSAQRRNCT